MKNGNEMYWENQVNLIVFEWFEIKYTLDVKLRKNKKMKSGQDLIIFGKDIVLIASCQIDYKKMILNFFLREKLWSIFERFFFAL